MKEIGLIQEKILSWKALESKLHLWKFKAYTIVFTNGCFDLIHEGHLQTLAGAADEGDKLIVGLNSDTSVKKLKGEKRPILEQNSRAMILASLTFVDAVVIFEEETPYELIKLAQPDVIVKGGDWAADQIIGSDIVEANHGRIVNIPYIEGHSTTNIEEKIKKLWA